MEHVKTFLESSSIHGLSHILRNRKLKQFFWLFIVFVGFTSAFILISTSFQSWRDTPVKTIIETLPISEIKLPKVTVCPPKNTYTDLNYDLARVEEKKLFDERREELYRFAIQNAEENSYMDALNLVEEENRFYNWYHGFSSVNPVSDHSSGITKTVMTTALSGSISTINFGQEFKPDFVWRDVDCKIYLNPNSSLNNQNVTLHIEIQKVSMTELERGKDDYLVNGGKKFWALDAFRYFFDNKFNPPGISWYFFQLERKLGKEDISDMDLEQMPGFIFKWYYTGGNLTKPKQLEAQYNRKHHYAFVRYFLLN